MKYFPFQSPQGFVGEHSKRKIFVGREVNAQQPTLVFQTCLSNSDIIPPLP